VPQGQHIYAIGDIHGRSDLLALLLDKITADAAQSKDAERRTLIFLGDYIDRGHDSRRVVDMLLGELPQGFDVHFLKGNHEAIMLDFLEDPSFLGQWLANGADATFRSYGMDIEDHPQRATPDAAEPSAPRAGSPGDCRDPRARRRLRRLSLSMPWARCRLKHRTRTIGLIARRSSSRTRTSAIC
jgi:serine/threonine protein phosphatase 1